MVKQRHEPGPPMDLANMRRQGVRRLIAFCLNDACRHQALIEVWSYSPETEIAYFKRRVVCAKCGARATRSTCGRTGKRRRAQSMTGAGDRQCRGMTDGTLARRYHRQGIAEPRDR